MSVRDLPTLNACLNAAAAVLLAAGWALIRSGRREAHRRCMLTASAVSAAFLVSYLTYHARVGHVVYTGPSRGLYLAVLVPHTLLAALLTVLVPRTLWLAWKGELPRHRRLARLTMPIWLYVSVTGVLVYGMLYEDSG